MSVPLSIRLSLKILVTTEPIGFYSSGNIPTGPVVVLGYFLGGWDTPNPPKNKKNPTPKIFFYIFCKISVTADQIGLYPSGNIPTGPLVVSSYFLGWWDTPTPPKIRKIPTSKIFNFLKFL